MQYSTFKQQFERVVLSHPLWRHPWFTLIRKSPSIPLLRRWAIQAGMIDELFVEILSTLLVNANIPASSHCAIRRNLNDELGNGRRVEEHFQLFRSVLRSLNISEATYRRQPALPGTKAILYGLRNAVQGDSIRAFAVMASEEFICPREFPRLMQALVDVGVSGQWHPYFTVHCEADTEHAADLLQHLYEECCKDRVHRFDRAFTCVEEDLNWNLCFYESLLLVSLR